MLNSNKQLKDLEWKIMNKKSRLNEITKKRYERKLIIFFAIIIFLLGILFYYSPPLLIKLSLILGDLRDNREADLSINNTKYIAPPVLNPLFSATNSAEITISGYAPSGKSVKIYLNSKYIRQVKVNDDKSFNISNLMLAEGNNEIKVKSLGLDKQTSNYSQSIHILYKNKPPILELNYPIDNQIISNSSNKVKVEGKTDSDTRVTVNDYWAIVDNIGNFSYLLNLQKGDNKIKIAATDEAGNRSEKEVTVKLE